MLSLVNVACVYPSNALYTFSVKKGDLLAIIGPNGCGKTILLNTIAGLYEKRSGQMHWTKQRSSIAYLGHALALPDHMKVKMLINAWKMLWKEASFSSLSDDLFDTESFKERFVYELSRGQKQRLALTRLLLQQQADCIILDEPDTGLDKTFKKNLENFLKSQKNAGIIITSHDEDFLNNVKTGEINLWRE